MENPEKLNKLLAELAKNFTKAPFPNLHFTPLQLVPKKKTPENFVLSITYHIERVPALMMEFQRNLHWLPNEPEILWWNLISLMGKGPWLLRSISKTHLELLQSEYRIGIC